MNCEFLAPQIVKLESIVRLLQCVYVCVCEIEREKESVREREWCDTRERERERERERKHMSHYFPEFIFIVIVSHPGFFLFLQML